jgi:ABC-type sulfate transport system substrate-binding protein
MPATLRIDTLKFVRKLTEAGMDRRQAEAIVDGLSEADTSELATKTDIAELRVEMREMKAEIFRAMLIQAGTIVGLTVALTKLLP